MTLITDIKKGNHSAFQAVYNQYHAKLFYYFLKRTRIEESAKELTQQSFIKLWQSRHTLSEEHVPDTQLFTIASSVFIDHLRRQAAERKHQDQLTEELCEHASIIYRSPTDYESANYLDAVSASLPPGRKNVFMMKIAKGYSNKEIAEQLSVSVKTVEDHYSKALKHVRTLLTLFFISCCIFLGY